MAVGKSTLARALATTLDWVVVDKDDAADVLVNYLEDYSPASYEIMFRQTESLLDQGFNVVMVSSFRGELGLNNAAALAARQGAELKVISCVCSDKRLWRSRLESRTPRPAQLITTWQVFEAYWARAANDFGYDISHPHLEIDTSMAIDKNIKRISSWLEE